MNNYEIIKETIEKIMRKFYMEMEKYLKNIFNAPSTINRIIKYYQIGFDYSKPTKSYILFNDTIVAEFEMIIPKFDIGIR